MVFEIFKRKKVVEKPEIKLPEAPLPKTEKMPEIENIAAKVDLLLAQLDRLRIQYDTLSTRISEIERMLKEIYEMAKS
jgi:hypothetical protein